MSSQSLKPLFEKDKRVEGMWFDPNTEMIYFLKSIGNKKIKFSTKVKLPKIKHAKQIANLKIQEMFGTKKSTITPLVKDELVAWIRVKESDGLDEATIKKVHQARPRIEGFWGSRYCHEINRDNLVDWYQWLEETYPDTQQDNAIKYMRNFCRYLYEKQHNGSALLPAVPRIADPKAKLVIAERRKRNERFFSQKDLTKVLAAANETEWLVGAIMVTHATRIEETLGLRFGTEILMNETPPRYKWTIGQNKADLWGQHSLHSSLIVPLMDLERVRKSEGTPLLFPQKMNNLKPIKPQQIDWTDWKKRANLGYNWSSKTFRHTCLSNLFADETNPQAMILKLYRVSLAVALNTYIHPTPAGIEKMRCALRLVI